MGLTFTVEEQKDLTLPEDSIHRAKLLEIKQRTINWQDRTTGEPKSRDTLEWWWEITSSSVSGDYVGRRVKGECDPQISNHPNNKFRNWAETLLGRQVGIGSKLDVDDLIGLQAEISIGHRQDKKNPDKVWEYVDEVLPLDGNFVVDEPPF